MPEPTKIIVVGAGSGIGRATALDFAGRGARVALLGRTAATVEETAAMINTGTRDRARGWTVDVTDQDQVGPAVEQARSWLDGLDVAVNSAGVLGPAAPAGDLDLDRWRRTVDINLTGTMICLQAEIAALRNSGGGAIVNIASNLGQHARPAGLAAYAASKAAVAVLTRTAARDHIAENIRINAVSPGPIDTTMSIRPGETRADRDRRMVQTHPSGRVGRLDEVVAAIRYLASEQASYHVGADLVIDGGVSA